jgi:hypothetical protein
MSPAERFLTAAAGTLGIAGLLFVLFITALWIIFPFVVWRGMHRIVHEQERQTALLEEIARNTRKPGDAAKGESSVSYKIPGIG